MKKKENISHLKGFVFETVETFAVSAIIIMTIYVFVAFPIVVFGASMEPSLHTGERILVEKVSKKFSSFERGEVVVLHPPDNDNIEYVKRIVGLPNDIVKIYECEIYILRDEKKFKLQEPYLYDGMCTVGGLGFKDGRSIKLGENEYLVLGDNRSRSSDSRVFGLISSESISGRALFRFWPLDKAGFL